MVRAVLIACFLLLVGGLPAAADCSGKPNEGVWVGGKPAKLPLVPFCTIRYTCGPKQTVMSDAACKMNADSELVKGACSAGSGPVDSCNSCLAAKPNKKCYYRWVKR